MAYRYDKDLEFLQYCTDEELNDLVYCLTHDSDGTIRLTEEITDSYEYKMFYPKHTMYWKLIANELQCFGGNTFINIFRGGGVKYREILTDVCDKLKVNYNNSQSVKNIEMNMFMKILEQSIQNMSYEERQKLVKSLNINSDSYTNFTAEATIGILQTAIKLGKFKSYQIAVIVANAVYKQLFGRGLSLAANQTLTKTISLFSGPIGWIITGLWTALDIAGPAYRVTIPAVVQVALLRTMHP